MKKLSYIFMLCLCGLLFSCKQDEPLPYDGLTGITFQVADPIRGVSLNGANPSYPVSSNSLMEQEFFFKYDTLPNTYRILKLPVAVTGYVTDFDRPISVKVNDASTLADNLFEIDTNFCYVPAGEVQALVLLKLKRPAVDDKTKYRLVLELLPNEYFAYVNGDGRYFSCVLSNENFKPQYWDQMRARVAYTDYFGLYSNNKMDFIHEILYNYWGYDYSSREWDYIYRKYSDVEGFRNIINDVNTMSDVQYLLDDEYTKRTQGYHGDDGWVDPVMDPIYDENTGKEIQFTSF